MLGDAKQGQHALGRRFARVGDAVPRTRRVVEGPVHDLGLLRALFADLSDWRNEERQRVCYLPLREVGGSVDAVRLQVQAIGSRYHIYPGAWQVTDAEKQEYRHGEVRIALPKMVFNGHSQQFKELWQKAERAANPESGRGR